MWSARFSAIKTSFYALIIATTCVAAIGCGAKAPAGPSGSTGIAPQISCSSDLSIAITGSSKLVSFATPATSGGTAPVSTTCTPASGSAFPVGTTSVTCVATDARALNASCGFSVTATAIQINVKKFETVGDSLTEGQNGLPIQVSFIDVPNSYPTKLNVLLQTTFPSQGVVVTNKGVGGQRVEETLAVLPGYLATDTPEAILLLSGYNNLTQPCHRGLTVDTPGCVAAVEFVEAKLRDCIRLIKQASSVRFVFVSTLTPSGPVAANATRDLRIDDSAIAEVNNRIRLAALAEGAVVVETSTAFAGHVAEYTSIDGLHLNPAGYQAIADTFFARILVTVPQSGGGSLR